MNASEVQKIVRSRFDKLDDMGSNIYRAQQFYGSTPIAVRLFDTSGGVASDQFDLGAYQSGIVRGEYYRVSGSLQWNLYCYLLCEDDDYKRLVDAGTVARVESDRIYARKLVCTLEQLRAEILSLGESTQGSKAALPQDVAGVWVDKCESSGFPQLTSTLSYTEIARQIEAGSGRAPSPVEPVEMDSATTATVIQGVDGMLCHGFRPKIDAKDVRFGDVNLICGPNGAGKTSLLEAIEMWFCGQSFRNETVCTPYGTVGLRLRGTADYVKGPEKSPQLYRDRDCQWFGNYNKRAVATARSFARFTFFHADAAARLELSPDSDAVTSALHNLILGEETTRIQNQCSAVLALLETKQREHTRIRDQHKSQRARSQAALVQIQQPTAELAATKTKLKEAVAAAGWMTPWHVDSGDGVGQLLTELSSVSASLAEVIKTLEWLPSATLDSARQAAAVFTVLAEDVKSVESEWRRIGEDDTRLQELAAGTATALAAIVRLREYVQAGGMRLMDQAARRRVAEARRDGFARAVTRLCRTNLKVLDDSGGSIAECEALLSNAVAQTQVAVAQQKVQLDTVKRRVGEIESILSDVIAAARQYVEKDTGVHACPVCNTPHTRERLMALVSVKRESNAANVLGPLQEALHVSENRMKAASDKLNALRDLKSAAEHVRQGVSVSSVDVRRLLAEVPSWPQAMDQARCELATIVQDGQRLESLGFTLSELSSVLSQSGLQYEAGQSPSMAIIVSALEKAEAARKAVELEMAGNRTARSTVLSKKAGTSERLAAMGISASEIQSRLVGVRASEQTLIRVGKSVRVEQSTPLTNIATHLHGLSALLESFLRVSQGDSKAAEMARMLKSETQLAERAIAHETSIITRLDGAIAVIRGLQTECDPQKVLTDFLSATQREIGDLFRMIHAPQEFDWVELQSDGLLLGRRKGTGKKCGVSQMSSGQRSALGISIFLTMNRLATKAPQMVLMDDPIAHVDDLNVLAFLDYLRDLVLATKRQVFFATASAKTAGLFRKKFDFLGSERFVVNEL